MMLTSMDVVGPSALNIQDAAVYQVPFIDVGPESFTSPPASKGAVSRYEVDTKVVTYRGFSKESPLDSTHKRFLATQPAYYFKWLELYFRERETKTSRRWLTFLYQAASDFAEVPTRTHEYVNVRFIGPATLQRINVSGYADAVKRVINGVRAYFAEDEVTVEWPEHTPLARPITVRIHSQRDLDEALGVLDRFDNEWWFEQDLELHKLIGVHLE